MPVPKINIWVCPVLSEYILCMKAQSLSVLQQLMSVLLCETLTTTHTWSFATLCKTNAVSLKIPPWGFRLIGTWLSKGGKTLETDLMNKFWNVIKFPPHIWEQLGFKKGELLLWSECLCYLFWVVYFLPYSQESLQWLMNMRQKRLLL